MYLRGCPVRMLPLVDLWSSTLADRSVRPTFVGGQESVIGALLSERGSEQYGDALILPGFAWPPPVRKGKASEATQGLHVAVAPDDAIARDDGRVRDPCCRNDDAISWIVMVEPGESASLQSDVE